jgi:hypothetical protein
MKEIIELGRQESERRARDRLAGVDSYKIALKVMREKTKPKKPKSTRC